MAQNIKLKRSAIAGKIPTTSSLEAGELAINTADGKLYFKRDDQTIQGIVSTNTQTTGSISLTGTVTAPSFVGTASLATSASFSTTSSFALRANSASYAPSSDTLEDVMTRGNVTTKDLILTSSLLANGQYSSSFILNTVSFDVFQNDSIITGTNIITSIPFAAGNAGHFEYIVRENSNIRTGDFYFAWDGSQNPVYYDVSTIDLGSTANIQFSSSYSGSNVQLLISAPSPGWIVRGLLKVF